MGKFFIEIPFHCIFYLTSLNLIVSMKIIDSIEISVGSVLVTGYVSVLLDIVKFSGAPEYVTEFDVLALKVPRIASP